MAATTISTDMFVILVGMIKDFLRIFESIIPMMNTGIVNCVNLFTESIKYYVFLFFPKI